MSDRSGRSRLLALWLFLTIAAVGVSLVFANVWIPDLNLLPIGTAVLGAGALCFLVVQFWTTGTRPAAPLPLGAADARKIDFTYQDAVPLASNKVPALDPAGARHHAAPPTFEEDLVEFEVAGPEAPTHLAVPPAFQVEVQADAEPVRVQPWIEQTIAASGAPAAAANREFVPAVERRQEIVSGLPLLSQIFSDARPATPTPAATQPGKSRGQCGSCGTFIWAPTQRPIRLRCPKCGHVKTLTE